MIHPWIVTLGGRRFLLTLGCSIVSTILVWHGKISGGEFVTVISLTASAYIAGNTIQKAQEAKE
jgi:hypothetical protein